MDCGPACLCMVANYYGNNVSRENVRDLCGYNREGVSLLSLSAAAEKLGFITEGVKLSLQELTASIQLPCILFWAQNHFVVLLSSGKTKVKIADPAEGIIKIGIAEFLSNWAIENNHDEERIGIALLIKPSSTFSTSPKNNEALLSLRILFDYLKKYKKYFLQLFLAIFLGSLLQLTFPILTQSIVDIGINSKNLGFITIVLIGQFMLFLGKTITEFIQSRLLLHLSLRINISILSNFWSKLMRLPLSFFDNKLTGDILQRISDHHRIENFLTRSSFNTVFSLITLIVFSIVLFLYNWFVFFIFFLGSLLYFFWIQIFLRNRRKLDNKRFQIASRENNTTLQLLHGMQEIRLNNAESIKKKGWEHVQLDLFDISFRSLSLNQYQHAGAIFINESKNILISFLVAKLVINGQLTLGSMLAIQYIIGQLQSPIEQLIEFIQSAQDAKISLERLNEIQRLKDEENEGHIYSILPYTKNIILRNLTFSYPGAEMEPVLKDISFNIPEKKVTAIVGVSGSGKTTLLKILLSFYNNYSGEIIIGDIPPLDISHKNILLKNVSPSYWRSQCGSVMQDGFIFNDTIAKNIAIFEETPNREKLTHACQIGNILEFVDSLPLGFNTKIGEEGFGISQGQKQRILIARAIYKDSKFLFFDEATNALDTRNENIIVENLNNLFRDKTVIIVAHRLSTVKNADNIVVLNNGTIIEQGKHEELVSKKGEYFKLVKNQLEI